MKRLLWLGVALCSVWLLSACGANEDFRASESNTDVLASLTRSGGLQGRTETLVVRNDGSVTLLNGGIDGAEIATGTASNEQLEALRTTLASDAWQQLGASYGRPLPDAFSYTILAGGKEVQTYDGAQNPPVLDDALQQLNGLWQVAR